MDTLPLLFCFTKSCKQLLGKVSEGAFLSLSPWCPSPTSSSTAFGSQRQPFVEGTSKWSSCFPQHISPYLAFLPPASFKPCGYGKIYFTLFVFVLVWTDCNSFTFVCFPETFLTSSNGESLACRSFRQLTKNICGSQSLPQSWLTTDMHCTAQLPIPWHLAIFKVPTRVHCWYSWQATCCPSLLLAPRRHPTPGEIKGCNLRQARQLLWDSTSFSTYPKPENGVTIQIRAEGSEAKLWQTLKLPQGN